MTSHAGMQYYTIEYHIDSYTVTLTCTLSYAVLIYESKMVRENTALMVE
jgi:hypothetical protein